MSFSNPIVALNGSLVISRVKSPNYSPGVNGWSINKDGSAEFNNLNARGTIDVGTPTTPNVIIGTVTSPAGTAQGLIEFTAPGDPHWVLPGYIIPTGEFAGGGTETGQLALHPPVYDADPGHTLPDNRTKVLITQATDGPSQITVGYLSSNKLTTSAAGTQITGNLAVSGTLTLGSVDVTGAWISYTPGWTSSTPPTLGNGTITGRYMLIGKTCHMTINLSIGSTTNVGAGTYLFSAPFNSSSGGGSYLGTARLTAGAVWIGQVTLGIGSSAINVTFPTNSTTTTATNMSATAPVVPASGNSLAVSLTYQIA